MDSVIPTSSAYDICTKQMKQVTNKKNKQRIMGVKEETVWRNWTSKHEIMLELLFVFSDWLKKMFHWRKEVKEEK